MKILKRNFIKKFIYDNLHFLFYSLLLFFFFFNFQQKASNPVFREFANELRNELGSATPVAPIFT